LIYSGSHPRASDSLKLSKYLVLSFQRQRYIIQTGATPRHSLRGATVKGSFAESAARP
jgi:hypothetical protein